MYLSTLVVGLLSSGCSGNVTDSKPTEIRSLKGMKFNFEKYDVKNPDAVKVELDKLFPEGSSLDDFRSVMEQSGAKCHDSNIPNGENTVYCQRKIETSQFVKSQWTVLVKVLDKNKISGLKVTAGYIGV
jgi:hypothetical protein